MRGFFVVFLICLSAVLGCKQNKIPAQKHLTHKGFDVNIEVPEEWIEKVRKNMYRSADTILLQQFEKIIAPDTLFGGRADRNYKSETMVFNPLFVNLDAEVGDELISLMGWNEDDLSFAVFKEIHGIWYLLYLEPVETFYGAPSLMVANNFSKNKTFYFKRVYNHGSGVYEDGYTFYKLINNKVHRCLDVVNEARIYGWGLYLNQEVKMNFEFTGNREDWLGVNYTYNFFPGAINKTDCPWCANVDVSLIKGDDKVWYTWDAKNQVYKFDPPSANDHDSLTAAQIACFGSFGNDSLFVSAFKNQINDKLKNGSPQQKKIFAIYLEKLKTEKTATTSKLKETTRAGATTFYSVDDK